MPVYNSQYPSSVVDGFTLPDPNYKPGFKVSPVNDHSHDVTNVTKGLTEDEIKELLADDFKLDDPMDVDINDPIAGLTQAEINQLLSL